MDLKADPHRVLMSDVLRDRLPPEDEIDRMSEQYVHVIIDRWIGASQLPLAGLLRSVIFAQEPELNVMVELSEALQVVRTEGLSIKAVELQHGEDVVQMPGPFVIKEAGIDAINTVDQTCLLMLRLQRAKK